jgi:hypothetical protein
MFNTARVLQAFVAMVFLALSNVVPSAHAQSTAPGVTQLIVYNQSNADVTCMVTVPADCDPTKPCFQSDGCPTGSVSMLRIKNLTLNSPPAAMSQFTPVQGFFVLKRGHRVRIYNAGINPYTRLPSNCLQGMLIGFGQVPNSCPDGFSGGTAFPDSRPGPNFGNDVSPMIPLPNGSNAFEVTLNLPGTVKGLTSVAAVGPHAGGPAPTAESIDISCVNGANAKMVGVLTPPAGGPYWVIDNGPAGGGLKSFKTATTFKNSWVNYDKQCDDNCIDKVTRLARPGVYPYGCTQCNTVPDPGPPPCGSAASGTVQNPTPGTGQFCAAKNGLPPNNGCGFNRGPVQAGVQKYGGTVQVNYLGPLTPPIACQ